MGEGQGQVEVLKTTKQPSRNLSRRDFLKLGVAASVFAAVGGELAHEEHLAETGFFETEVARWHPIYERHDQHEQRLIPKNIPPSLDALSLELIPGVTFSLGQNGETIRNSYLQVSPSSLLTGMITGYDTFPPSENLVIPIETLEYLKYTNSLVAFGDIQYTGDRLDYKWQLESALKVREQIGDIFIKAGLVAIAGGQALRTVKKIDRRGFLRLAGASMATAGAAAYLPAHYKDELHVKMMDAIQANSPQQRLLARLETIGGNLMPEDMNNLFRELTQANKLISLAKRINQGKPGGKAEIGYNWHLGHRGIEDWLRLGEDVVRACILAFPDDVLKQVIEANENDPRALYAIRLIQVPKSLEILQVDRTGVMYRFDDKENIRDNIIEDDKLAKSLKERNIF